MVIGYRHLCFDERVQIEKLIDLGKSVRYVVACLGRSPSTISREVQRNGWRPSSTSQAYVPYRPAALKCGPYTQWQYRASIAQDKAAQALEHSHRPWRMTYDPLLDYVVQALRRGWTPEMIAGRLRLLYPEDKRIRICAESIYQWVYSKAQKWRELVQ